MSALASKVRQPLLVRLTYVKNANKARENVRTTLRTLGFTKLNQSIVHKNVLPIRGMIHQVRPLSLSIFCSQLFYIISCNIGGDSVGGGALAIFSTI